MKPQPLVSVRDVPASSRWYQELLGLESAHGGDEYERLTFQGELVLQLHRFDVHDHPHLAEPIGAGSPEGPIASPVLLWFQVDPFDATVERARSLGATILEGPKVNPAAFHRECWLADLDGHVVVVAGPAGDLGAESP